MNRTILLQLSGGLSSWQAGKRLIAKYGLQSVRSVFCDTVIEDNDLYRFLIEGAANLHGVPRGHIRYLATSCLLLPLAEDGPEALAERKRQLAEIRIAAAALIPQLVWLCDGRTPFEIYRDERFLGNSRIDPCSKILKRQLADKWRNGLYTPADVAIAFGLNYDEETRIDGIRSRLEPEGWELEFPLCDYPHIGRAGLMLAALDEGITPPALYYDGFGNNNCGGGCCKMGQKSAKRLLEKHPNRFAMWEREEREFQAFIGKPYTFLKETREGEKFPLSLRILRERVSGGCGIDESDTGACSCFAEPESDSESIASQLNPREGRA